MTLMKPQPRNHKALEFSAVSQSLWRAEGCWVPFIKHHEQHAPSNSRCAELSRNLTTIDGWAIDRWLTQLVAVNADLHNHTELSNATRIRSTELWKLITAMAKDQLRVSTKFEDQPSVSAKSKGRVSWISGASLQSSHH